MFTGTFRAEGALPETPVTVIGGSTVDRSLIRYSVEIGKVLPGGGVVAPLPPTCRRRFGEPLPGLPTAPETEFASSAEVTWAGVAEGLSARYRAAAPATCGVAIEVLEMLLVALSPVCQAEVMDEPGAKMSRFEP